MDKLKGMMPTIKVPKKIKKIRQWNTGTVVESINNLSQLVNRYIHPQSSTSNVQQANSNTTSNMESNSLPLGISTISGRFISDTDCSNTQKDNYGLYALKCDRNAAKKGLLLNIPLKLHQGKHKSEATGSKNNTLNKEKTHEKFSPCRSVRQARISSMDSSFSSVEDMDEEILQIEIESSDAESICKGPIPAPPPRRRRDSSKEHQKKKAPDAPMPVPKNESALFRIVDSKNKTNQEPTSLASFVVNNHPENIIKTNSSKVSKLNEVRTDSVDIFKQESENVFQEFDNIFQHNQSLDEPMSNESEANNVNLSEGKKCVAMDEKVSIINTTTVRKKFGTKDSFSNISTDSEETILMNASNSQQKLMSRCRVIEKVPSINDLKSPRIVAETQKKVPQSILKQKSQNQKPDLKPSYVSMEKPLETPSPENAVTKKFFVYYNDEDELVFNPNYSVKQSTSDTNNSQQLSIYTIPTTGSNSSDYFVKSPDKALNDFNHIDALYKHYYCEQNDSLRSMVSSDGIFI